MQWQPNLTRILEEFGKAKGLAHRKKHSFWSNIKNRWFPYIGQFFKFSLNNDKIIYEKSEAYLIFVIYVEKLQALKGKRILLIILKSFHKWVTGELTEKHY